MDEHEALQRRSQQLLVVQEREENDLRVLLDTMEGRRFIKRLLEETGLYDGSFTGDQRTFYLEGRRDVGLWIRQQVVAVDPKAYLEISLMKEETQDG